jgi:hypothetical protein
VKHSGNRSANAGLLASGKARFAACRTRHKEATR